MKRTYPIAGIVGIAVLILAVLFFPYNRPDERKVDNITEVVLEGPPCKVNFVHVITMAGKTVSELGKIPANLYKSSREDLLIPDINTYQNLIVSNMEYQRTADNMARRLRKWPILKDFKPELRHPDYTVVALDSCDGTANLPVTILEIVEDRAVKDYARLSSINDEIQITKTYPGGGLVTMTVPAYGIQRVLSGDMGYTANLAGSWETKTASPEDYAWLTNPAPSFSYQAGTSEWNEIYATLALPFVWAGNSSIHVTFIEGGIRYGAIIELEDVLKPQSETPLEGKYY